MTAKRLGKVQQILLLCTLAVGVVTMHHVGMASAAGGTAMHAMSASGPQAVTAPPSAGSGEHDPGMPGGLHDILHLCLAVLCAAGALLLAVAVFLGVSWFTTTFSRAVRSRGSPSRGRPPDGGGRSILTSLCVLRT
ncbi:hypothetical protein DMA12_14645 [Amycolatopsis balhimycina DSM 5908]|uniref:DUF2946 domain-containing protein n=1 Tax=Amycolatopsis balhimycina DSM 5908 TaxID=1081091 RepID=A0A428WQ99_AMYBA|nr:DUF6153 family protein [Amycolatopsis balhimycina]RSM45261.1 hypothetical protein DMA12_14645 [Amycolatopsis balhimycina DSM 5908]